LGLCIVLALLGGVILAARFSGRDLPAGGKDFYEDLRAYDAAFSRGGRTELEGRLDQLEKNALGMETLLSVLKRRRALAEGDEAFRFSYRAALDRALKDYPFSEALAALAGEAAIRSTEEAAPEELEHRGSLISDPFLMPAALGFYALGGSLADPEQAAALPQGETLLSTAASLLREDEQNTFLADFAILRLLRGDVSGAAAVVNTLILNPQGPEAIRFGAEFLYDYGDPLEAARLFARLPGTEALTRQADALFLAGHNPRDIWLSLIAPARGENASPAAIRALYNLAVSSENRQEKRSLLEKLIAGQAEGEHVPIQTFGIIRYTRLLDTPRAIAILEGTDLKNNGLLDLELLRRRRESWTVDRTIAETWLLVNRHPADGELYQWGAYFFDRQKRYDETTLLLQNAGYNHIAGPWIALHQGMRLIREGRTDEAEALLKAIPSSGAAGTGLWQVPANLARIQEARRRYDSALEYYEIAASGVKDPREAARVQLRIARCLGILGREREIRRVLEYARDLDPENLTVRLELHRLDSQGIY
jgi:Flp pilus assembly protein TadD